MSIFKNNIGLPTCIFIPIDYLTDGRLSEYIHCKLTSYDLKTTVHMF